MDPQAPAGRGAGQAVPQVNRARRVVPRKGILSRHARHALVGYLMAAPAMLFFLAFAIYPMFRVFYLSVFRYDLTSPSSFVGLANFEFLAEDPLFHGAIANTVVYVLGTYLPTIALALLIALVLDRRTRLAGGLRTVYFIPVAMSWVVVSIIWRLIFHSYGLFNEVMHLDINWLMSTTYAPVAIVVMSVWKELGFFLIVFLAGLQSINRELYEAAAIDGAGGLQRLWHITLPLLKPVSAVAVIFAVIRGMQAFTPQYVMTGGGPESATQVINLYVYKTAFQFAYMGRASAVAVLLFLALLMATIVQLRFFKTDE